MQKQSSKLQEIVQSPWRILLLDLFGALITALATWILFSTGWLPTGLPTVSLKTMAVVAFSFSCFDAACFFLVSDARKPLKIIAILNLLYVGLSIAICWIYAKDLTLIGMVYFSIEFVLVVSLACWEWKIANRPPSIRF